MEGSVLSFLKADKGNNKITELRTILQRESQNVSEKKIFRNQPIRNKNCLWQPYLLLDWDEMSNLYGRPPIDASYQVSVHLAKRFQRRRFFRNHPK
jgi:hypothetical protein